MNAETTALAALFEALAEVPARLTAMEREMARVSAEVAQFRASLPPTLVSVSEAASAFKVSVPTMRRWVRAGSVPIIKVGNTVRVDLSRLHGADEVTVARLARSAAG